MAGSGMKVEDHIGLQTVNGLVSGCIGLLQASNMHRYRMSEMCYQAQLNMENMRKGKEMDFLFQQQLQSERFQHELEAMQLGKELDFRNGARLQTLSHTFRVKEAENMFEQQMALKDREDNKQVWPLQTAIGQADLFRKDRLISSLPVNVFVVANDEFKSVEVEQEINRNLESFFAYRDFGLNSPNAVFGRFGSWKSKMYSKQENINLLWSVMKGVPVMVIRPEFRDFGEVLRYRIFFRGNSMNQEGYTQEDIFETPYEISDNAKKKLLVKEVSPLLCCFAGMFCDCYHLIERGVMPQMPFAMKNVFGKLPEGMEEKVIDIYKSCLYALTQTNYLGDYTPVAYLNVIKVLLAIGSGSAKLAGQKLMLESMVVWENGLNGSDGNIPAIPASVEEGIDRVERIAGRYGVGHGEYVAGLQGLLADFDLCALAERVKALEGVSPSSGSASVQRINPSKTPSGKLVKMMKVEGGTFTRGKQQVTLSTFYIGKYPVTQQQWKAVMEGKNPSCFQGIIIQWNK